MIIGNGLVAKAFDKYSLSRDVLIFASGVSDSKESTKEQFERERKLLEQSITGNKTARLVYFGTSSVSDPDLANSAYVRHKLAMEDIIKETCDNYLILRLPNLAGFSKNSNTVLNFLYLNVSKGVPFTLWKNSERNIIDIEDVFKTADFIIQNKLYINTIVNIANTKNYPVRYVVGVIESYCNKKGIYNEVEKGSSFSIDLEKVLPIYKLLNITFADNYLASILAKYYKKDDI